MQDKSTERMIMKKKYFSGRKIFVVRNRKKLELGQLAKKSGITESHLKEIEQEHVKPSIRTIIQLAEALDVDVEMFFD